MTTDVATGVTVRQETLAQCLDDHTRTLLLMHWTEVAPHQDIPLDPDYDTYYRLEAAGCLRVYILREHGIAMGYAVFTVLPNMKYRTSIHAMADLLFLAPHLRKQGLGREFLAWVDDQLRAEGVQIVRQGVERTYDFSSLLDSLGYELEGRVYARRLDR
jgi:GNAT superfamily N-acetyltransferase